MDNPNRARTKRELWIRAADYWWVLVVPAVILALAVAAYLWNPIKTVEDELVVPIGEPIARSLNIQVGRCAVGWEFLPPDEEGHRREELCRRGSVFMILYPASTIGNLSYDTTAGGDSIVYVPCRETPDWPDSRCAEEE